MTAFGYDPRFGPIGYQPVEFLDIPPMGEVSGTGARVDLAQHVSRAIQSCYAAGGLGPITSVTEFHRTRIRLTRE